MTKKGIPVRESKALLLGITFKENCPDIRNTKVIDVYNELKDYGLAVEIYDPWADAEEVKEEYDVQLSKLTGEKYDAIILAVAHDEFKHLSLKDLRKENSVLYDVKGFLDRADIDARL